MAENETVMQEVQPQPEESKPSKGAKFLAGVKEWCRKTVVKLKRKPQTIPMLVLAISTIFLLCSLYSLSTCVGALRNDVDWIGLYVFVTTLVSILVLVTFLNAFPKRKKPNIVFIVMVFVEIALIVVMDVLYFLAVKKFRDNTNSTLSSISPALTSAIVHIVLVGIGAILLATLPLYKKLLMKINTRKVLESTELKEEIDTEEEV